MDTSGRIIEDPIIPSDYPVAMAGQVAGKLDVPADYKDIFQSHFDRRRLLSQPESGDYYSFSRAHPIQYADDAWLNRLMEKRLAEERKIKEGEYKEGGEVDTPSLEERLTKAIANDMASGGEVDSLESRLTKAIAQHNGMAEGGSVFKTIQWKKPQHFDGGGMAVDLSESEPLFTKKELETIKRNAPAVYDWAKQNVKDEASQLKTAGGLKDFALRTGAQYLGGIPDLVNLGLMIPDALAGTKLASEKPWFGSEQYIDAMHKAGMLGENEFPISETVAGILAPAGLIKKGIKKVRGFHAPKEELKKRRGGLAAMSR
jgi:hypothetical protein